MKHLDLIIITGLSGSGKSTAINALEDAGYFCVDNMPVSLMPKFLELRAGSASEVQKIALGMDLRQSDFVEEFQKTFEQVRREGLRPRILFLDASDDVLLKRYSETRRHHPMAREGNLLQGIQLEREKLESLKAIAERVINSSHYTVHELKEQVTQYAYRNVPTERMRIALLSFGFKYGVPQESDLLADVRFIPNPYFIPELKKLDGRDERVRAFVLKWQETHTFLDRYGALLEYLIPLYEKEGKSYLTIAIGCTGGRHRSITVATELADRLKGFREEVGMIHRDLELGG
jgi:RNase adapter protein RapZ